MAATWANWGRNQRFEPKEIVRPATEDEAIDVIGNAIRSGTRVRIPGSGHSFTPVVETDGLLADLSELSGLLAIDGKAHRAEIRAGSTIASIGEPLWNAGLSLANQGDVDVQTLAGATATGTKGSGLAFGTISSSITSMRLINGHGDVVDIDQSKPDLLHAAQVSLGLLGPILRIGLQLVPAYGLKEENIILPIGEVLRQWDYLLSEYRHFSFWWMPTDRSADMYKLGDVPADHCFVKLLREVPADGLAPQTGMLNARTGRAYCIYPDGTTDAEFHELEYMVPSNDAREAVLMMRDLMVKRFPDEISPLQVRWQKGDQGWLSGQYKRDSTSLSVSGEIGRNYEPFLRAVDGALAAYGARPHWGKLHFLDKERARAIYPRFDAFNEIRQAMDPRGLFLNPHLSQIFG